jgi:hypothetical protein
MVTDTVVTLGIKTPQSALQIRTSVRFCGSSQARYMSGRRACSTQEIRRRAMAVDGQESIIPERSMVVDGKKYLWDGHLFESPEDASKQAEAYKNENFEVHLVEQGGKHLVYTRRVVKEVVVAAP